MSNHQHPSQVFPHTDDDEYVRRPRKRLSLGTCLKHAGARANTDSLPLGTGPGGQSPRCYSLQTPEPKHVGRVTKVYVARDGSSTVGRRSLVRRAPVRPHVNDVNEYMAKIQSLWGAQERKGLVRKTIGAASRHQK
jgi:hypothetical protein